MLFVVLGWAMWSLWRAAYPVADNTDELPTRVWPFNAVPAASERAERPDEHAEHAEHAEHDEHAEHAEHVRSAREHAADGVAAPTHPLTGTSGPLETKE
jgi:hypothetical protein